MTKHDIRFRRHQFSARRMAKYKNYSQLMDRHRRSQRARLVQYAVGLVILSFVVGIIYYTMFRIEKQSEQSEPEATELVEQPVEVEGTVTDLSESQPKPAQGMKAYYDYLEDNLEYPSEAQDQGVEGNVYVGFTVEVDGRISEAEVMKGIGSGCDEEALRLVVEGPSWVPASRSGEPVQARMVVPVTFKLE